MNDAEFRLWNRAYAIAEVALLRPDTEFDPLAMHCMAECIVSLAKGKP